jgi:hypothetical protein
VRLWLFFPLTYLAGVHGFALFTPYLLAVLIAGHWMHRPRVLARIPND